MKKVYIIPQLLRVKEVMHSQIICTSDSVTTQSLVTGGDGNGRPAESKFIKIVSFDSFDEE